MKWYWLSSRDSKHDFHLLHEVRGGELERLPRFLHVGQCRCCWKFSEDELLKIGFDPERVLNLPQDILTWANDIAFTAVTETFRHTCLTAGIGGVDYLRCGRSRKSEPIYLLRPQHASPCHTDYKDWLPRQNLTVLEFCSKCQRPFHTVGFPSRSSLDLPDPLTISIPGKATEMRHGRDFRFMCSEAVRAVLRKAKLKGCCFCDLESPRLTRS